MKKFIVSDFYYHDHSIGPINFSLSENQLMGISGVSGCGKSLLLRALADLDINQGSVQLDNIEKNSIPAPQWRQLVSLLPAESQWWFDHVGEHFNEPDNDQLKENFIVLGFPPEVLGWTVSRLSSGEKQRLSLLRCLQNKPQVLLLDEPSANLDTENTELFENFIKQYVKAESASAVWVSHDLQQIDRLCDMHYQLKNGSLLLC